MGFKLYLQNQLQCFDTVGLVIWPVKIVKPCSINQSSLYFCQLCASHDEWSWYWFWCCIFRMSVCLSVCLNQPEDRWSESDTTWYGYALQWTTAISMWRIRRPTLVIVHLQSSCQRHGTDYQRQSGHLTLRRISRTN